MTGDIPTELGNLFNLEWIALRGNQLTGCVPDEFHDVPYGDVSQLGLPYCAENEHATLLEIRDALVGDGTALNWAEDLDVSEWDGVGINFLKRVTSLSLSEHGLRGILPAELGSLSHLASLNLSRNLLSGALPAKLGRLTNLRTLNLSRNGLTGEIPVELSYLSNLRSLSLHYNRLSGEIPAEFGNLHNLSSLVLSFNQLSGEIPVELTTLPNCRHCTSRSTD